MLRLSLFALVLAPVVAVADEPLAPRIAGDWWAVAGNPDVKPHTLPKQQPVDFAVWQAADGKWELLSCIRGTKIGGKGRLLHRWEGETITAPNWAPAGIAMTADPAAGEEPGGLQAPFVLRHDGTFYLFYGDWNRICLATSPDGKTFQRHRGPGGKTFLFTEGGPDVNTRDPMVLRVGDKWHCYYSAHPGKVGTVFCRTSTDLLTWGEPKVVARGGAAGTKPASAECPFVVQTAPDSFYLFRTQIYAPADKQITRVYHSRDPLDFGIDTDAGHLVAELPVAAPEIAKVGDQHYIVALDPQLKGIRVAKLEWAKKAAP